MIHDQHIHTSYSRDSKVPIDEYYKIASDMGCKYFVCTDHIEFMSCYNHIDWTVDYVNQDKDLERLGKLYPNVLYHIFTHLFESQNGGNEGDVLKNRLIIK